MKSGFVTINFHTKCWKLFNVFFGTPGTSRGETSLFSFSLQAATPRLYWYLFFHPLLCSPLDWHLFSQASAHGFIESSSSVYKSCPGGFQEVAWFGDYCLNLTLNLMNNSCVTIIFRKPLVPPVDLLPPVILPELAVLGLSGGRRQS